MADRNEKLNALNDTADTTGEFDKQDIEQNKIMALLAYLSWLVLIPLIAAKMAEIKNTDLETVASVTTSNAERLFAI